MKVRITPWLNEFIASLHAWERKNREWSWLLKCKKVGKELHAYDIFFPKQENNGTHTEFTDDPVWELLDHLGNKAEEFGEFCIWIHSHHNMQAFRSGEDRATRKAFKDRWCKHFISIVTSSNKGTHNLWGTYYHGTLDIFDPIETEVNIQIELGIPEISEHYSEDNPEYLEFKEAIKSIAEQFDFSEEDIEEAEKSFKWDKVKRFYTENDYAIVDFEKRLEELKAAEVVKSYSYPTLGSYKSIRKYNQRVENNDDGRDSTIGQKTTTSFTTGSSTESRIIARASRYKTFDVDKIDEYEPMVGRYNTYIFQKDNKWKLYITKKGDPMVKCIGNKYYPLPYVNCFVNEYSNVLYDYKDIWSRNKNNKYWSLGIPYSISEMLKYDDLSDEEKEELDLLLQEID